MKSVRAVGLAASLVGLGAVGCATYSDRTQAAHDAMARGDLSASVTELNKFMRVRDSEALPRKWKKDFELVLLERATVLQAIGQYDLSKRDYQLADKKLELLDIARDGAGKIGKYIYSDSAPKYKTSPTEKLALNAMNLCNYLVQGDLSGAKIEAKRFTVMRNYMRDYDPEHEHGAFGSYLAGFVYEQLGQANEALRYYDEALQTREFATLRAPIARLAQFGSYRGDRIRDYLPSTAEATEQAAPPADGVSEAPASPSAAQREGQVLVIAKTGRVPHKEPRRIPIGAAIGLAGAFIVGDTRLLEYGMFKVVVYPELVATKSVFTSAAVTVDGHPVDMDLASDLSSEIVREYDDLRPKIIGSALTRMIARAAAAEAGRAAGRQAENAGGLIGFLAAAAIEGTMVALDRPDTRSWTTLPARVEFARLAVPAGQHTVEIDLRGPGGRERRTTQVDVAPGGFAVVDVTTLR